MVRNAKITLTRVESETQITYALNTEIRVIIIKEPSKQPWDTYAEFREELFSAELIEKHYVIWNRQGKVAGVVDQKDRGKVEKRLYDEALACAKIIQERADPRHNTVSIDDRVSYKPS